MMLDPPQEAPEELTYFERPLLKKPHWEWNVVTYLFLGGVMGGSGVLSALSQRTEDAPASRSSRYLSLALAAACPAVLISHLGRPERFLNMLRIVKFKSVMSMGVWGLVGFSGVAAINVVRPFRPLLGLQGLLGAFIAGYTGVLLSSTAIPLWGKGKYHIPAMSVCSAISSACAANMIVVCTDANAGAVVRKLERLEACAALAELATLLHFRAYAGSTGNPMFEGPRGERLRKWTLIGGIAAPLLLNAPSLISRKTRERPSLLRTLAAAALTLAGGYILRETLIEAGKASADDPAQAFIQPT